MVSLRNYNLLCVAARLFCCLHGDYTGARAVAVTASTRDPATAGRRTAFPTQAKEPAGEPAPPRDLPEPLRLLNLVHGPDQLPRAWKAGDVWEDRSDKAVYVFHNHPTLQEADGTVVQFACDERGVMQDCKPIKLVNQPRWYELAQRLHDIAR